MACSGTRTLTFSKQYLYSASDGSGQFLPSSEWMSTVGFTHIRAMLELYDSVGTLDVQAAYQVTDTPDSPPTKGTYTKFGPVASADGDAYPTVWTDIADSGGNDEGDTNLYIRFGAVIGEDASPTSNQVEAYANIRVDLGKR